MKAEELRIRNYVFEEKGQIAQITGIEDFSRVSTNEGYFPYTPIDKIQSIPLTEEWLVKFGFHACPAYKEFEHYDMPYYANSGVLLFYNSNRTEYELSDYHIAYAEMRSGKYYVTGFRWIKYVHQLQNIYQSLTGNELTIK